jgi:hypothetical protein
MGHQQFARKASHALIAGTGLFLFTLIFESGRPVQTSVVPDANAIPAFARKYQTACSTCHNDFPQLNDFGEAFWKNGFKFPKDDETFVKEPPVLLGSPAQREAFPNVVYPGEIPGAVPIAFRYSGFVNYANKRPPTVPFTPRTDLFVPNTFTVIAAGSFGPRLSFWVDDDISAGGSGANGALGDGYLKANDVGHYIGLPKDALNVRFGQFELRLPFTQARTINPTPYDVYNQTAVAGTFGTTNNPFIFGEPQRGIEIGGYPNDGNFEWAVAVVNGNNTDPATRNSKDIYARVAQQFNLDRDPKIRKEVQAAGPTGPRDHTSIRLGTFYYYGRNALNIGSTLFPEFGTIHEPFYRVGGDVRFKYRNNFKLYGLLMYGRDQNLIPSTDTLTLQHGTPITFTGGFGQAEYWVYPWLIGIMRYDGVNSFADLVNGASRFQTRNRFSPGVQILVRENIKVLFEYQRRWQQSAGVDQLFFRRNGFVAGIDYAF